MSETTIYLPSRLPAGGNQNGFPRYFVQTQALLETPNPLPPSMLARSLLNDLDQIKKPSILVLDDLHVIHDKAIFDFLTEIMEHPPRAMHMVLISRQDPPLPVASLRAYRLITEIRMRDLRFKPAETAKLLKQVLQREIEEELANEWTRQTEGWPTALHLVALSLRSHSETTNIRANIQEYSRHLQEYLLVEVLNPYSARRTKMAAKNRPARPFLCPFMRGCLPGRRRNSHWADIYELVADDPICSWFPWMTRVNGFVSTISSNIICRICFRNK